MTDDLQKALQHHRAGELPQAEQLYRAILQTQPNHPDANHNLGVIAVGVNKTELALPFFKLALDINPNQTQFWLSYIDALIKTEQFDLAQNVLNQAYRQSGLTEEKLNVLAEYLKERSSISPQSNNESSSSSIPKKSNKKKNKPFKSVGKSVSHTQKLPSNQEINELTTLFGKKQYAEAVILAKSLTVSFPFYAFGWNALGVAFKQMGENLNALSPVQKAIELSPNYAEAHYNLGDIFWHLGRLEEAKISYQKALKINPDFADAHSSLGLVLIRLNQLDKAEASYRNALRMKPDFADGYCNLGYILRRVGRLNEAESSYRQALRLRPDSAETYNNLCITLRELGQLDDAEINCRQALQIKPDYVDALSNLGIILRDMGRLSEAESSCRQALQIHPDSAEIYNNLGVVLRDFGRLKEAENSYNHALQIKPDYADAYLNLGNCLKDAGRFKEAENSYKQAIAIKPDYAKAHNNLASTLNKIGKLDEAEYSYRAALNINPNYAEAHHNLGNFLENMGRLDEAEVCYQQALKITPKSLMFAVCSRLSLPVISQSIDEIVYWRDRYKGGITALMTGDFDEDISNLGTNFFYLAYQNKNDKSLMEALSQMFRHHVTNLTITAPHITDWKSPAISHRPLRLGIVSQFLMNHTIGKLFRGFIQHLDRNQFEVVVIHVSESKDDEVRQSIDKLADKVLTLPHKLRDQQALIIAECFDVLFYPDIGMNSASYFLAYSRLAPVQAVSWGHPNTTGLDSMDYFISSSTIELPNAQEHYTERLVCLNRMPCYYEPFIAPSVIPDRHILGLPETGTLYGCPQTLFKFHPDFDSVLASIANGDPSGHIVLIEGQNASWEKSIKKRWEMNYPILLERVIFLPKMSLEKFMMLMACVDLLLDPIYFGSGNTMYEAMVYGTPVVTCASEFMRGRFVAGCYKQMGIENAPVANCIEDYSKIALTLGSDLAQRQNLREKLREAAKKELFSDMRAVKEFEIFLLSAVKAAQLGEKLPVGWRPLIVA